MAASVAAPARAARNAFPVAAAASPHPAPPPQAGEGREGVSAPGEKRVCVGVVTAPHGIRGAVRIKSFTAMPEDVAGYGPLEDESGRRHYELQLVGSGKGVLLAHLSGVEDRNQAEGLRGLRLYLPRAALPATEPDEYYHADLIGLAASLADGVPVGTVRAVHDFGAGDTLEIDRVGAPPVMVPFTRAIVPVVDLVAGRLVLDPPPGLLDGTGPKRDPLPPTGGEGRVRGADGPRVPPSPRPSPPDRGEREEKVR